MTRFVSGVYAAGALQQVDLKVPAAACEVLGPQTAAARKLVTTYAALIEAPNLASFHLRTLLESLSSEVDLVVVDTIPLANLADASLLSESADEAIVVAQAGSTNRKSLPAAYRPLFPPCERRQPVHTL